MKAADAWGTAVLFLQAPIVGLLIAAVFSKVVRSTPTPDLWPKIGVNMATTLFVTALAAIWFGCSSTAREIVTEWPIYRRERMVGLSIPAYVLSKMTVLLGVAAIQSLLLLAIVVPACRMNTPWLELFAILYAAALAGGAIGLFVSATLQTAEAASGILPVLLLPMIVLGGILVPLADLPALTRPLAAAMPSRWAFEGLVVPEAATRPRIRVGGPEPDAAGQQPRKDTADDAELEPVTPPSEPLAPADEAAPQPDAPTAPEASLGRPFGPFRLAGQGGSGHQFILPGRRKIAEKLEEAAGQAKQEIEKAKAAIEEKAKKIQEDMKADAEKKMADAKAEFERKSAESAERMKKEIEAKVAEARDTAKKESEAGAARMKEEMEKRVAEAREQGRKESADARAQVRAEIEEKVAATKAEVQRQSDESATKMREEVERKVAEAQEAAKKESDAAGSAARADIEKRVRDVEADFEKKSREATAGMEAKLRDFQERLDAERAKMNESLESVRAATRRSLVPPAGRSGPRTTGSGTSGAGAASGASGAGVTTGPGAAAPAPPGGIPTDGTPVDMAERFFGQGGFRSARALPLAVLLGMFVAGVAGTGLALRRRER